MDKLNYLLLKHLKNLAEKDDNPSLQTGLDYLANYFNMEVNEESDKKFGEYDLPTIFTIGDKWISIEGGFEKYLESLLNSKNRIFVKEDKPLEVGSKQYEARLNVVRYQYYGKYIQEVDTILKESKNNTNNYYTNYTNTNNNTNNNDTKTENTEKPKIVFKTDVSEENKKEAEALKNKGNDYFKNQDFENAIKCYTEAIEIYSSAIYYCNRGTSYGKIGKHNEALEDLLICIELDPKYVRAYDRLGCTYMRLNNHEQAVRVFQQGLKIDPNNQDLKTHLQEATHSLESDMGGMGENPQMPNMENLQNMLNNLGPMQEMLQNNPQIMNMAMNLMNDPNFQQTMMNMMNNPGMSNLFNQMMGGQGGNTQ